MLVPMFAMAVGQHQAQQQARKDTQRQNRLAQEATSAQMAFQERMSNTAHQRQMRDLELAGLNPILSAKYGGASTPTGSTYKPENPSIAAAQASQANSAMVLAGANASLASQQAIQQKMNTDFYKKYDLAPAMVNFKPGDAATWKVGKTLYDHRKSLWQGTKDLATDVINSAKYAFTPESTRKEFTDYPRPTNSAKSNMLNIPFSINKGKKIPKWDLLRALIGYDPIYHTRLK